MLKVKLNEFGMSRNRRTNNIKIPSAYKKGDLFYELIDTWNNLPSDIKEIPESLPNSKKNPKLHQLKLFHLHKEEL